MTLAPQPDPETNAWRIYHNPNSGVWIDHFAGRWLVQTSAGRWPDEIELLAREAEPDSIYWRPRDQNTATVPAYQSGKVISEPFLVRENGASFRIDFSAGYSPGIFLDQRENRNQVRKRSEKGMRVLNAFAYTGAFSVMAALGGAETTTLDLSKNYLDWTWENFAANQLDRTLHHGCKGDAFEWLATFARQERQFEGIILDPPTFSRNRKRTFRTDRDYAGLVTLAARIVAPGGWMLCCVNTHRLGVAECGDQVERGIREAGRRVIDLQNKAMPLEFNRDDYLKSLWVDVG